MNNKKITQKAHNAIAEQYYQTYKDDKSDLTYFDEFLSLFNGKILDLGCGMGHYSNYMFHKGFTVTGIDFSASMIRIAKKSCPHIEFIKHDICNLNILKNKKYDGVVIAYVLQHLSKNEVLHLFNSLSFYTSENAKLLLFLRQGNSVVKEIEPMNPKFEYVINEYSEKEIKSILNSNDWEILKIEDKPFVDDINSLAPNTLVVIAQRTT